MFPFIPILITTFCFHLRSILISGAGPISIDGCDLGKFGSIVKLRKLHESEISIDLIGRQLCQHVVGMKPTCIDKERVIIQYLSSFHQLYTSLN